MPEIPLYEPRGSIPAINTPKIDAEHAGDSYRYAADSLKQFSALSMEVGKQIQEQQSVRAYGNASVAMQKDLMDLHDNLVKSPEFFADPKSAEAKFLQGAEEIRKRHSGTIGTPRVEQQLLTEFNQHAFGYLRNIRGETQKQQIAISHGDLINNRQKLIDIAINANTPEEYEQAKMKWENLVMANAATGLIPIDRARDAILKMRQDADEGRFHRILTINPDQAATMLTSGAFKDLPEARKDPLLDLAIRKKKEDLQYNRTLENQAREDANREGTRWLYEYTKGTFKGDPRTALAYLEDPRNLPDIDPAHKEQVKSWHRSDLAQAEHQQDRARIEQDRTELDKLLNMANDGKLTAAEIDASKLSGAKKYEMATAWKDRQAKALGVEHPIETELTRAILSGDVKEDADIIPFIGRGARPERVNEFRSLIKTVQDPFNKREFAAAIQLYKDTVGKNQDLKKLTVDFEEDLAYRVRTKQLKGQQILDEAHQILQPAVQNWWSRFVGLFSDRTIGTAGTTTQFEVDLKSRPWARPAPPVSNSTLQPSLSTAPISDKDRALANEAINMHNRNHPDAMIKDPSDAQIRAVLEQLGKGSK